jgi:hypothetical protein
VENSLVSNLGTSMTSTDSMQKRAEESVLLDPARSFLGDGSRCLSMGRCGNEDVGGDGGHPWNNSSDSIVSLLSEELESSCWWSCSCFRCDFLEMEEVLREEAMVFEEFCRSSLVSYEEE